MELRRALQQQFQTLRMRKPAASRNRSVELHLLARGKRACPISQESELRP